MQTIFLPGSKSYTNRALLIASLANGKSVLRHALRSDDTQYMLEALQSLGIKVEKQGNTLIVQGNMGKFNPFKNEIYIGNAGTAMRFLTALLALVPAEITLTGNQRMLERPIKSLVEALKNIGVEIVYKGKYGFPPIKVKGKFFSGGEIKISGKDSSQYLSSILMIAPYALKDTKIKVIDQLTSKPYIDITLSIMKDFGIKFLNNNYQDFFIKAGQAYQARTYEIEADASSASYFLTASALTKQPLKIVNLGTNSCQGDIGFINLLQDFGFKVFKKEKMLGVTGGEIISKNRVINMKFMPDLVPTLSVMAALVQAKTEITNIGNLRIKETDRIQALENELQKLDAQTYSTKDSLTIIGKDIKNLKQKAEIETYDDHRIVMSFAIMQLLLPKLTIKNPECVAKSYPDFWEDFKIFK